MAAVSAVARSATAAPPDAAANYENAPAEAGEAVRSAAAGPVENHPGEQCVQDDEEDYQEENPPADAAEGETEEKQEGGEGKSGTWRRTTEEAEEDARKEEEEQTTFWICSKYIVFGKMQSCPLSM